MKECLEEFFASKQYEQKYRSLFDYFCSNECLCFEDEDEDLDEFDWSCLEQYMNNAVKCITKGFSKEWTKKYVGGIDDRYGIEYVELYSLQMAYKASKKPEDDLKLFCSHFSHPDLSYARALYYINENYKKYRSIDINSTDWIDDFTEDVETWNDLLWEGRSEEYIDRILNNN